MSIKFNYKFNDSHGRLKGKVARRRSARGAVIDQGGQSRVRIKSPAGRIKSLVGCIKWHVDVWQRVALIDQGGQN